MKNITLKLLKNLQRLQHRCNQNPSFLDLWKQPIRVGSYRVGSGHTGSDRVGSGRVGSGRVGSYRIGSGRVSNGEGKGVERLNLESKQTWTAHRVPTILKYCSRGNFQIRNRRRIEWTAFLPPLRRWQIHLMVPSFVIVKDLFREGGMNWNLLWEEVAIPIVHFEGWNFIRISYKRGSLAGSLLIIYLFHWEIRISWQI